MFSFDLSLCCGEYAEPFEFARFLGSHWQQSRTSWNEVRRFRAWYLESVKNETTRQHRRTFGQGEGFVCVNASKAGRGRVTS